MLTLCLNLGIAVVSIDCAGSGASEGGYVSLRGHTLGAFDSYS